MNHLTLSLALLALTLAQTAAAEPYRSTLPQPRNVEYSWMSIADWYRAHADDVEVAATGEAEVLFVGDSIFQGWEGAPSWKREFSKYKPANFSIGGDKTENLLWRIQNGATGKLAPKVVVMLIGVNNFGHNDDSPEAVFAGVKANIEQLKQSFPGSKILALGVFPFGEKADDPNRGRVKKVNRLIKALEDDTVTVLDVGEIFLEPDGSISKEIMADFLHPTHEGYDRLAAAVAPAIAELHHEN